MSDDEESYTNFYGKPLEQFDEDEVPSKRPLQVEDQIATDEHGRRRFHGAFTGGFSAGFFNTVGSLEGWRPQEFKSSRSQKAACNTQKPEDFMDAEDVAEFGFAPERVRTKDEYDSMGINTKKRRRMEPSGPIPGQPVLELLVETVKDTVGIKLLKRMGWKPGQGVGPRQTQTEKKRSRQKIYGCEKPPGFSDSEDSLDSDEDVTFAPDDYEPFVCKPKNNSFGLNYSGLSKELILSRDKTSKSSQFTIIDQNNKRLTVSGSAFGVGAFEEEDEDIYMKDDMTRYDFSLGDHKGKKSLAIEASSKSILSNYVEATKTNSSILLKFPPPILPKNFKPIHGARISRFEPLPVPSLPPKDLNKTQAKLKADDRRNILNDNKPVEKVKVVSVNKVPPVINFAPSSSSEGFKPFASEPEKQERYEKYLQFFGAGEKQRLGEIQPLTMTEWDRDRERVEFEQAAKMFKKPASGLVFDKFVTAQHCDNINDPMASVERTAMTHGTLEMRNAAKMKMFGKLTREIDIWQPHAVLCKRFNVVEPHASELVATKSKKKGNFSVFDYLEAANDLQMKAAPKVSDTPKPSTSKENKLDEKVKEIQETPKEIEEEKPKEMEEEKLEEIPEETIEEPVEEKIDKNKVEEPPKSLPLVEKEKIIIENKQLEINTEENIDLYKAIFLSDDSNDSIEEVAPSTVEKDASHSFLLATDVHASFLSSVVETTSKQEPATVEPNRGIFANLNLDRIQAVKKPQVEPKIEPEPLTYGPQLPIIPLPKQSSSGSEKKIPVNVADDLHLWSEKMSQDRKKKDKHKHKKTKKTHKSNGKEKKKKKRHKD